MFKKVSFAVLCAILIVSAACDKKINVTQSVTGPSPTSSPPVFSLDSVTVTANFVDITLNACPADVTVSATVHGTNVTQDVTWRREGDDPVSFDTSGVVARIKINHAGRDKVIATANQNGVTRSGEVVVTATGSGGSAGPPPAPPSPGPGPTPAPAPTPAPTPTPTPARPIVTLAANPSSITVGESSLLTWTIRNEVTFCSWIRGKSGIAPLTSGSLSVSPTVNTTYTYKCVGPGGEGEDSATVTVTAPAPPAPVPTCVLSASPMSIAQCGSSTLTWSSSNATAVTASGGWSGNLALSGSRSVVLAQTTVFTIVCTGPGGSSTASVTITVTAPVSVCAGANASLPDLTAKGQTRGFAINASSGCHWALRSNNTHVVSTNPAEGYGPSAGTVTSLNSGTATIQFIVNPGPGETVLSSRTYIIP